MKRIKVISVLFLLVTIFSMFTNVCMAKLGSGFDEGNIQKNGINPFEAPISRVWGTVILAFQIASIGGIIFMGVRYMFASASDKASIKNSTIYTIIGIVMVFAVSTVIKYLMTTAGYLLNY